MLIFQEKNKKKSLVVQLNYLFDRFKDDSISVSVVEDSLDVVTVVVIKKLNRATNKLQKEIKEKVILQN